MTRDLAWQFDLAWALADLHLCALTEDDFLWEPAALVWTVRPDADGVWRPDWADNEPDPIPVPTIAWLTWHIDFWWSTVIDHLTGKPPRERDAITWPGDGAAAVERLRALAQRWRDVLTDLDPAAPSKFPWGAGTSYTAMHTALWVNVELTKNIAEIGQLRLLRSADFG
ncbi:DinB family protein [Mycolicibacterium flavescens]|uniref:Damage-inducible protein DinB n=1 Tax=Mycolicibacterium flavescens TaxID=1776 RepID=A0A1E3RKC2_MYCFV|nr:DinB family protein [Mycolicibacterium flavescens]MCV7281001.1 DinB family protein [Mycolicibacterium flavescens]ODQ90304.1 damage-inducible protein DinB [Mycolicibacterium flavescens]